jgi:hypothetical protein
MLAIGVLNTLFVGPWNDVTLKLVQLICGCHILLSEAKGPTTGRTNHSPWDSF